MDFQVMVHSRQFEYERSQFVAIDLNISITDHTVKYLQMAIQLGKAVKLTGYARVVQAHGILFSSLVTTYNNNLKKHISWTNLK